MNDNRKELFSTPRNKQIYRESNVKTFHFHLYPWIQKIVLETQQFLQSFVNPIHGCIIFDTFKSQTVLNWEFTVNVNKNLIRVYCCLCQNKQCWISRIVLRLSFYIIRINLNLLARSQCQRLPIPHYLSHKITQQTMLSLLLNCTSAKLSFEDYPGVS